jgi:hypothetical protein
VLKPDDVITGLMARRDELLGLRYQLAAKPDEQNRTTKDVDAIFESASGPAVAIEHTSLLTFHQQIRDEQLFKRWVAPVEAALRGRYGDLWIGLGFLYARGGNWPKDLVTPLRAWLDAQLGDIPFQKSGEKGTECDIPGVGVVSIVKRNKTRRPGVHVSRTVPQNVDFPGELVELMDRALDHKYNELAVYRGKGLRTLMLLDARDIALTNEAEQYKAYLRARGKNPRPELDEIWLASVWEGATEDDVEFYCFRAEENLMRRANPENFMFEPRHDDYWQRTIAAEDASQ